jgi:hypothetical protein
MFELPTAITAKLRLCSNLNGAAPNFQSRRKDQEAFPENECLGQLRYPNFFQDEDSLFSFPR